MPAIFPFTAIVGQQRMKTALILNAINPKIGGVLIRGERGTAKSTAARALAALLPEIDVFVDSPFNDDPNDPSSWSDWVKDRQAHNGNLEVGKQRIRFIDLPVSATEDRVVGTLDIEQAIKKGERHFEPGVLAAANRGLLYVDEVNLLDDHVVDLLLDSAAMGVNVVEREGISFSHPSRFLFVGTMNPEEGDLRPQLLDRFALCVDIQSITDSNQRMDILERTLQFEMDSDNFYQEWHPREIELAEAIMQARDLLPKVSYTKRDLYTIAELMAEMKVDGHRADIVILKTALAHAAFNNRKTVKRIDILVGAELALPHRLKRQPFQDTTAQFQELSERLEEIREETEGQETDQLSPDDSTSSASQEKKKTTLSR
jgi:Mg-chelatase subunit ChlI